MGLRGGSGRSGFISWRIVKHHFEAGVILSFQFFELTGQLFVRRKNRPHPDESAHHLNTRINCHCAV
jgi:hypothetical protein